MRGTRTRSTSRRARIATRENMMPKIWTSRTAKTKQEKQFLIVRRTRRRRRIRTAFKNWKNQSFRPKGGFPKERNAKVSECRYFAEKKYKLFNDKMQVKIFGSWSWFEEVKVRRIKSRTCSICSIFSIFEVFFRR